ncbi:hypothetical protein FXF69_24790 [Actinomadura chibensis]|uniref:Iminophenyl-pyruvate dimer synthase domain-containing protein n=2 Tax=Actinomadura chibensis TaxID=392828 RepID=A0A5D0NIH1_9ACTN|nr:hypothetical protein FXF69_24790 [Actinomadura chibensis]
MGVRRALGKDGYAMAMLVETISAQLTVPEDDRDIAWLRESLQAAIAVELATIPPYLYGMWSIKDKSQEVYRHIHAIVMQEMLHMGLACNLLSAVGGHPEISAAALHYPAKLPGGVRENFPVYLEGLAAAPNKPGDVVKKVYMEIEMPEHPVAFAPTDGSGGRETFPTIGAFYQAVKKCINKLSPQFGGTQQAARAIGLFKISKLADANKAIDLIIDQGEGRPETGPGTLEELPADRSPAKVAHYYRFKEIWTGHHLKYNSAQGKWKFDGPVMKRPAVYPLAKMGASGVPSPSAELKKRLKECNDTYHLVLSDLETAWKTGREDDLDQAVDRMRNLEDGAAELIKYQVGRNLPKIYGPEFTPPPGPRTDTREKADRSAALTD